MIALSAERRCSTSRHLCLQRDSATHYCDCVCELGLNPVLITPLQGAVVNVSSIVAIMPMGTPMMTSYGVAKAAQDTLTKNLAFEFATKGVRVNSVLPGAPFLVAASSPHME